MNKQYRDGSGNPLNSTITIECIVCHTKTSKPYGYVKRGRKCVCSKQCDEDYKSKRSDGVSRDEKQALIGG